MPSNIAKGTGGARRDCQNVLFSPNLFRLQPPVSASPVVFFRRLAEIPVKR